MEFRQTSVSLNERLASLADAYKVSSSNLFNLQSVIQKAIFTKFAVTGRRIISLPVRNADEDKARQSKSGRNVMHGI